MPLTNFFMDEFANWAWSTPPTGRGYGYLGHTFLVLGTGTGTPAETDTGMFSEIGGGGLRSSTVFGSLVEDHLVDTTNDLLVMDYTEGYVYTNATGGGLALTEIGFARASTGSISYHDLLRSDPTNPASSAITLNVSNGEQVQVYNNRTLSVAWPAFTTSEIFIDDGSGNPGADGKGGSGSPNGLYDVQKGLYYTGSAASIPFMLAGYFFSHDNNTAHTKSGGSVYVDTTGDSITRNSGFSQDGGGSLGSRAFSLYVSGTYTRKLTHTITTALLNSTWNAVLLGGSAYGYMIDFTNPTGLDKTSLQETRIALDITWSR